MSPAQSSAPVPCLAPSSLFPVTQNYKLYHGTRPGQRGYWGHPRSWGPGPGVSITWLPASEREGEVRLETSHRLMDTALSHFSKQSRDLLSNKNASFYVLSRELNFVKCEIKISYDTGNDLLDYLSIYFISLDLFSMTLS